MSCIGAENRVHFIEVADQLKKIGCCPWANINEKKEETIVKETAEDVFYRRKGYVCVCTTFLNFQLRTLTVTVIPHFGSERYLRGVRFTFDSGGFLLMPFEYLGGEATNVYEVRDHACARAWLDHNVVRPVFERFWTL